jgi:hypothetical protein
VQVVLAVVALEVIRLLLEQRGQPTPEAVAAVAAALSLLLALPITEAQAAPAS